MPRSRKPERYPTEFSDLALAATRADSPIEIPTTSVAEAPGLRTKLYSYFAALDSQIDSGPQALARRLVAARRIELLPGEEPNAAWAIERARDLLEAAAVLEVSVLSNPPRVQVARKSENRFARMIRAALDTGEQPTSAEESLRRLQEQLGGDDGTT